MEQIPEKIRIAPNGIDFDHYSKIKREEHDRPTVALIGRVVPIKDIKTFIRAVGILHHDVPDLLAYIMGPRDEDKEYAKECFEMVEHLDLHDTLTFTGKVDLAEYLGKVDIIVLTSISEAQPLVILEAGAAGIPSVTTDVGACSEMIYGLTEKDKALGASGAITPLANPQATAIELLKLIKDKDYYQSCCKAATERAYKYYNKTGQDSTYAYLYEKLRMKAQKNQKIDIKEDLKTKENIKEAT